MELVRVTHRQVYWFLALLKLLLCGYIRDLKSIYYCVLHILRKSTINQTEIDCSQGVCSLMEKIDPVTEKWVNEELIPIVSPVHLLSPWNKNLGLPPHQKITCLWGSLALPSPYFLVPRYLLKHLILRVPRKHCSFKVVLDLCEFLRISWRFPQVWVTNCLILSALVC